MSSPCGCSSCPEPALKGKGYCQAHLKEQDRQRGTAAQRGYGSKWQRARKLFLLEHPLCVECEREGRVEAAVVVDHIEPHKGDTDKFWSRANWQGLCERHHTIKTRRGE